MRSEGLWEVSALCLHYLREAVTVLCPGRTKVFDLYETAILQSRAADRSLLVIGHRLAVIALSNTQPVDREARLLRYPLVQVTTAALDVDARFRRELGNTFALETGQTLHYHACRVMGDDVPRGCTLSVTGFDAIIGSCLLQRRPQ